MTERRLYNDMKVVSLIMSNLWKAEHAASSSTDFFKEKVGAGPSHQNEAAPRFQNDVFVMQMMSLPCFYEQRSFRFYGTSVGSWFQSW